MSLPPSLPVDAAFAIDEKALDGARSAIVAMLREAAVAGRPVALITGNTPEAVAAREACASQGALVVPASARARPQELAYVLAHARPAAILAGRDGLPMAEQAVTRLLRARRPPILELPQCERTALADMNDRPWCTPSEVSGNTIGGTILYTSGTSGKPKGCVRTGAQDAARAQELIDTYALCSDDVHLVACPLAYSAPGIFTRAARAVGARTVILPHFSSATMLDAIAQARVTVAFVVPTQLGRLIDESARRPRDLGSLRALIVAGAPMPRELRHRAVQWLGPGKLWEFYGSSETGTVSVLEPKHQLEYASTVGRIAPGVDVKVLDEAGRAATGTGVLWVRSPTVMSGYWNPSTGAVDWPGDDDGFVSVGDRGAVDAEGFVTLRGRQSDMIISGGSNVYPAEVERAIRTLVSVDEAVVFGLADPDWGQIVVAILVAPHGQSIDLEQLRAGLKDLLSPHKVPKRMVVASAGDVPRTTSGKIRRHELTALLRRLESARL